MLTNDRQTPKQTLSCKAKVKSALKLEPSRLNFGLITSDSGPQTKTIKITRGDGGPLNLEVQSQEKAKFTTELREIEPGEVYELDVTVGPPWPTKNMLRGSVKLKTGVENAPTESITVYAKMQPRVDTIPNRFMIRPNQQSDVDLTAQLRWTGENPGRATEVTTTDPQVTVRLDERNGRQLVVLHVPAGYQPDSRRTKKVIVKTDDPQAPTVEIPIRAQSARKPSRAAQATGPGSPTAAQPRKRTIRRPQGNTPARPSTGARAPANRDRSGAISISEIAPSNEPKTAENSANQPPGEQKPEEQPQREDKTEEQPEQAGRITD